MTLKEFIKSSILDNSERSAWTANDWMIFGNEEIQVLTPESRIDLGSLAHHLGVDVSAVLWSTLKSKSNNPDDSLHSLSVLISDLLTTEGIDMGREYNQEAIDNLVGAIPEFTQEMADILKNVGYKTQTRFEQAGLGRVLIGHIEKALVEVNK